MIKFGKVILLIFMLFFYEKTKGQSIQDAYLLTNLQTSNGISQTTGSYYITISDTNTVDSIKVNLGVLEGEYGLLSINFKYDLPTSLPQGILYQRNENVIMLSLGSLIDSPVYYSELSLKDVNGNWGPNYNFISN